MIKTENYGKITENSRNLPENSLKNPKQGLVQDYSQRIEGAQLIETKPKPN